MKTLKELKDFIDRANAAERWDDIPKAEWEDACYFASVGDDDVEDYGEVLDRLYTVWYSYTVCNDHSIEQEGFPGN